MNNFLDDLKNIKNKMKETEKLKEQEEATNKQKAKEEKLIQEFLDYTKDSYIRKI